LRAHQSVLMDRKSKGVAPRSVYTSGTPTRTNVGERLRDTLGANTVICRCFRTSANVRDAMPSHSHGRGRWFETSIAHSGKTPLCRKNRTVRVIRYPALDSSDDNLTTIEILTINPVLYGAHLRHDEERASREALCNHARVSWKAKMRSSDKAPRLSGHSGTISTAPHTSPIVTACYSANRNLASAPACGQPQT
jgi:hypothetical protein